MNTNPRKQTKQVLRAIRSGELEKLALTAGELAGLKNHRGISALHFAAEHQCLDQIKGGVTAEQLSRTVSRDGTSALLCAAHFGSLHQVKGGVTVAHLKVEKSADGISGLMYAANDGYLHQIHDDLTAADLANERLFDNTSALLHAAFHGQLYLLQGGVTAEELAAARANDGNTALHAAANSRCLDQIKGGVTFAQMTAIKDDKGQTPLYWAAREGCLNQISGGVTMSQMKTTLCDGKDSAWDIACRNQNEDQIPGSEGAELIARMRMDFEDFLPTLQMCCDEAVKEIKSGDRRLGERLLIKGAIDSSWIGEGCKVLHIAYGQIGNHKEALKFAAKAVERSPQDAEAWLFLGRTYFCLNQHQRALSALEQSHQLDSELASTMVILALVKNELNHPPAEIEALSREAVETAPEYLMGWQWLAAYLEDIGKHEASDQAHYEFCKRKLGGDAVEFGLVEGLPIGLLVNKDGAERLRKEGPLPVADPSLN